jgi:5-methylcytosine-specific restriction endonuclease McrA
MAKRNKNQKKFLIRLIQKHGSKCRFCGERVVRVSSIPESNRVSVKDGLLTYMDNFSRAKTKKIATVEHVVRLADGGTNSIKNLVVACVECNSRRNEEANEKNKEIHNANKINLIQWEYAYVSNETCVGADV